LDLPLRKFGKESISLPLPFNTWTGAQWSYGSLRANDHVLIRKKDIDPTISGGTTVKSITFEEGAGVNLLGSLSVTEAVKVDCVVEASQRWYSVGFPFDIETVYSHYLEANEWPPYELSAYSGESGTGDFWLKKYDATTSELFEYTSDIEAGKGYIIQFPEWFYNTKITFISKGNQTLTSVNSLPVTSDYRLVANPKLNRFSLTTNGDNIYYYKYDSEAGDGENGQYIRQETVEIAPFEAVITIREPNVGNLAYSIGIDSEVTGIHPLSGRADDPVIATSYYTLQGLKIQNPLENGIYLAKKVYASGKEEVIKILHNK
jgi:hypothetical protein